MKRLILCTVYALLALAFCSQVTAAEPETAPAARLRPDNYLAFLPAPYDGYKRFSVYVTARDGTRIAVDYYRPTKGGVLHSEKLPAVWSQQRYLRAVVTGDRLYDYLYLNPNLLTLLRHGYVIAVADVRGSGASFGKTEGWMTPKETTDAYDVTEWLAAQPWSSGKVGMTGRSYLGMTQYMAASSAPPSLKAIIPEMALFDSYDVIYPGGIFGYWYIYSWSTAILTADISAPLPVGWRNAAAAELSGKDVIASWISRPRGSVAPVDDDVQGQLLARAIGEHKAAASTYSIAQRAIYRDSRADNSSIPTHIERSPGMRLPALAASHVAAYHVGGWFDGFNRDTLLWYKNWPQNSKVLVGPWFHGGDAHVDLATEYLRWFDHWLKGIDNDITSEPSVTYFTVDAPAGKQWRTSRTWPLSNQQLTRYYFQAGRTGSVSSTNDGALSTRQVKSTTGSDAYTVDYTTTVGIDNRWTQTGGGGLGEKPYSHMRENDEKGLTYSTQPLKSATEVTGHPVVHLWVSPSSKEVDLFAYLEKVLPDGQVQYITEGQLRASFRALDKPPYDRLGLPYHRSFAADSRDLTPGELTELVFDLQPTSTAFSPGERIRLTLTGADKDTFDTPIQSPAPTIRVSRGGSHASYVELPIIPH